MLLLCDDVFTISNTFFFGQSIEELVDYIGISERCILSQRTPDSRSRSEEGVYFTYEINVPSNVFFETGYFGEQEKYLYLVDGRVESVGQMFLGSDSKNILYSKKEMLKDKFGEYKYTITDEFAEYDHEETYYWDVNINNKEYTIYLIYNEHINIEIDRIVIIVTEIDKN